MEHVKRISLSFFVGPFLLVASFFKEVLKAPGILAKPESAL